MEEQKYRICILVLSFAHAYARDEIMLYEKGWNKKLNVTAIQEVKVQSHALSVQVRLQIREYFRRQWSLYL